MNRTHLEHIFNQYITEYDVHNDVNGDDEGYKWRAVECFKKHWRIDAQDFTQMFKDSFKEMSNLIDNASVQPVGGILMLLNHTEEIEFVRSCFQELFSEDNGDIDQRQKRVEQFVEKINSRIDLYAKGSWKYPQSRNNVIYYLNLWKPEDNYIYKASEANEWVSLIEYGDDFGSGQLFNLGKYYKMCDEILIEIRKNKELMELYKKQIDKVSCFNDDGHIMVYDVIYCAKAYGYYKYIPTFNRLSVQQRIARAQKLNTINELQEQRSELCAANERLTQTMRLPEVVGKKIVHNRWGEGTVVEVNRYSITVDFENVKKQLQYPNEVGKYYVFKDEKDMDLILDHDRKQAEINDNNAEIRAIENKLRQFE